MAVPVEYQEKSHMNNKQRICFAIYDFDSYGGVESVAINIANAFSSDYDVYFLGFFGNPKQEHIKLNDKVKTRTLLPEEYRHRRLRSQLLSACGPLKSFLSVEKIDLFVILGHFPALLAMPAKPFINIPFIFCDHGALCNQLDDKKATLMRYIASKMCEKVVVLTEKSCRDYIDRFHIRREKVSYIYNWIESSKYDSIKYDSSTQKIISVGRLSPEKGYNQLVEAMKFVVQKHPSWTLDIYGDGDEFDSLEKQIESHGLDKNVFLRGRCDNIRMLYNNYAMYVMPSYREGLPVALLEAKINRLPVVSFDVDTGPREIIRDGIDGFLVEPRNINALSDTINRLIEDEELRIKFSKEAKGNLDLFEKDNIIPKWRALFDEVMQ